jgi:bifunctional DNA-binding transcriptional regulator/antitoxin component of YhaV-PrlF toxin-antitoxin module
MTTLVEVRKKAQITLPQVIRAELNIEIGDILEARVTGGKLVLSVKKLVDKDQAWFWTRRWQEGERQAEADIKAGRVRRYNNAEDLINDLHREVARGKTGMVSERKPSKYRPPPTRKLPVVKVDK